MRISSTADTQATERSSLSKGFGDPVPLHSSIQRLTRQPQRARRAADHARVFPERVLDRLARWLVEIARGGTGMRRQAEMVDADFGSAAKQFRAVDGVLQFA